MPANNSKFSAIISFFEMLATQHVAIKHSSTDKHFFRLEFDEVMTSIHESACFPLLVLEGYSFNLGDAGSDNGMKTREGSFMLIDHLSDPGDFARLHEIWDTLEEIGDDIIARIRAEKRVSGSPLRNFNISSVTATLFQNTVLNTAGIRFSYTVESSFILDVNPDKWIVP